MTRVTTAAAGFATVAAIASQTAVLAAVIAANRTVVNVSPTTVKETTVYQQRSGPTQGSRSGELEY